MPFTHPTDVEKRPAAIIGAGTLGRHIALMLATRGGEVWIFDKNAAAGQLPSAAGKDAPPAAAPKATSQKPATPKPAPPKPPAQKPAAPKPGPPKPAAPKPGPPKPAPPKPSSPKPAPPTAPPKA